MPMKHNFIMIISFLVLIGFGSSAHATLWKIDAVLTGAGVDSYGASSFHRATDGSPMSGSGLGTITAGLGSFGTWDDVSGMFDATFNLSGSGGPTFDADGQLLFTGTDLAACVGTCLDGKGAYWLTVDFAGTDLFLGTNDGDFFFLPGHVCCELVEGPNSIIGDGMGGKIITLWGANGFNGTDYTGGRDTDLGMDLRIHVVQLPAPTSMMLMSLGLLGLGLRRWIVTA